MIHVIAVITTKPGKRADVLDAFRANMPAVHAEDGCIEYQPVVDTAFGTFATPLGEDTFMVIEKWSSADTLKAHAASRTCQSDLIPNRCIEQQPERASVHINALGLHHTARLGWWVESTQVAIASVGTRTHSAGCNGTAHFAVSASAERCNRLIPFDSGVELASRGHSRGLWQTLRRPILSGNAVSRRRRLPVRFAVAARTQRRFKSIVPSAFENGQ